MVLRSIAGLFQPAKFPVAVAALALVAFTLHLAAFTPSVYAAAKGAAPVAHWTFNEGGGGTAYDESANNNDGTLAAGAGGTNTTVGQMWTRQGKLGGALTGGDVNG